MSPHPCHHSLLPAYLFIFRENPEYAKWHLMVVPIFVFLVCGDVLIVALFENDDLKFEVFAYLIWLFIFLHLSC